MAMTVLTVPAGLTGIVQTEFGNYNIADGMVTVDSRVVAALLDDGFTSADLPDLRNVTGEIELEAPAGLVGSLSTPLGNYPIVGQKVTVDRRFMGALIASGFTLVDVSEGSELTELAFADFDTGTYRLEGVTCTFADLFSSGTVAAAAYTTGNALKSDAAATPALYNLLAGDGFTVVADYWGEGSAFYIEFHEPGYAAFWDIRPAAGSFDFAYEFLFNGAGNQYGASPTNDVLIRLAGSMSSEGIAASTMGEPQNAEPGPPGDWEQLLVFEIFNGSGLADIKKLTFYSIQADVDLPTLSAI